MTLPQQLLFGAAGMGPAAAAQLLNLPPYREGVAYTKRVPNCQKCGQHGRKSRLKGHKRVCPFKDCNCPKCQVVSERQKLMADQIKIRRRQRKDTLMNLTREKITATLNAAAAVAAVPVPGFPHLSALYSAAANNQSLPGLGGRVAVSGASGLGALGGLGGGFPAAALGLANNPLFAAGGLSESGRGSPMSINSLATSASSAASTSCSAAKPYAEPQLHHHHQHQQQQHHQQQQQQAQLSPACSSSPTSAADLTPPQSAGLAAPIPLNPLLGGTPPVGSPAAVAAPATMLDSQQLLQLLLLCQQPPPPQLAAAAPEPHLQQHQQQQQHHHAAVAPAPPHEPQHLQAHESQQREPALPQQHDLQHHQAQHEQLAASGAHLPGLPEPTLLDVQEQLQQLLALAAMGVAATCPAARAPLQQLSPPPDDMKKFGVALADDPVLDAKPADEDDIAVV